MLANQAMHALARIHVIREGSLGLRIEQTERCDDRRGGRPPVPEDLVQRVVDLDEIGLVGHDLIDVLVRVIAESAGDQTGGVRATAHDGSASTGKLPSSRLIRMIQVSAGRGRERANAGTLGERREVEQSGAAVGCLARRWGSPQPPEGLMAPTPIVVCRMEEADAESTSGTAVVMRRGDVALMAVDVAARTGRLRAPSP
jgi:hypothetical protein